MSFPERHDGSSDNILYFPFRRGELEPGPSALARTAAENEEKFATERFGTKVVQRRDAKRSEESERHQAFLNNLEKFQFQRALEKVDCDKGSDVDVSYVFSRASQFLDQLSEEEFNKRFVRIWDGTYTNGDVVRVATHYLLGEDFLASRVISRMVYSCEDGKESSNFQPIPQGSLDAVDLAIQNQ